MFFSRGATMDPIVLYHGNSGFLLEVRMFKMHHCIIGYCIIGYLLCVLMQTGWAESMCANRFSFFVQLNSQVLRQHGWLFRVETHCLLRQHGGRRWKFDERQRLNVYFCSVSSNLIFKQPCVESWRPWLRQCDTVISKNPKIVRYHKFWLTLQMWVY